MQKLVAGIHQFRHQIFGPQRELFERLAHGQNPETLFITCSDSRIDPNLITHTDPGDLFVLRNAGNIVPAYGAHTGGEVATIEFAIEGLKVSDIVVCGHSHCGAIKGLLHPEYLAEMPAVVDWLKHAEATRRIVRSKYRDLPSADLLAAATEENVLVQLENLETHPSVRAGLAAGKLKLHAWLYEIETGTIHAYDATTAQFQAVHLEGGYALPFPARLRDVGSGDGRFHQHDP